MFWGYITGTILMFQSVIADIHFYGFLILFIQTFCTLGKMSIETKGKHIRLNDYPRYVISVIDMVLASGSF